MLGTVQVSPVDSFYRKYSEAGQGTVSLTETARVAVNDS